MLTVSLASTLFAVCVAGLVGDRMLLASEDARLRAASMLLMYEAGRLPIIEAAAETEEEVKEMAPAQIEVALFDDAHRLAGSTSLPEVTDCSWDRLRPELRVCGLFQHGRTAVAGAALPSFATHRLWLLAGALAAAAAAMVLSLFVSRRVAARAVQPLTELSASLEGVTTGAEHLPISGSTYAELEPVRAAVAKAFSRVAAANARARRFAANAAHELRTPLATLRADLELQLEDDLHAQQRIDVQRVHRTVCSLGELVERLLSLAQNEQDVLDITQPVALGELAREVIASLPIAARERVTLTATAMGTVRGDPRLLRQLIENSVDNALKFSGELPVVVDVSEQNGAAVLEVADRGPGVSPDEAERVFEPFYRSPRARAETDGHGLGLSLVALIARAHGASADFAPSANGAVLRIVFRGSTIPR